MAGQVVFGDNYFPRIQDEAKVWRQLQKGGHLLLLAPRRVGKTSLLRHLEGKPQDGFVFLYVMVQSCNTGHEFYQEILAKLYDSGLVGAFDTLRHKGKGLVSSVFGHIKSIEGGGAGLSFQTTDRPLTASDLAQAFGQLALNGKKLILVLDEYPDVLEKISQRESPQAAVDFLAATRSLCQTLDQGQKVQFIFTGSIGLDTLAQRLGSSGLINFTDKITLNPLSEADALAFIGFLARKNGGQLSLDAATARHFLQKVAWLMPYYIEILWERLEELCLDNAIENPGASQVDQAFEVLFGQNYKKNFNHWVERLRRFDQDEQKLAKAILGQLALVDALGYNDIHNLFQAENYRQVHGHYVLDCLEHDGYLFEHAEKSYRFTSPVLKEWWRRYADRII